MKRLYKGNQKSTCKICGNNTTKKYENLFDDRHGYPGKFHIYECSNCGFMQTSPQLKQQNLTRIYSTHYPRQKINIKALRKAGKNIPSKAELYWKGLWGTCHYGIQKGEKVLDVGSGTGRSLIQIKALGGKAWGIDPDENSKKIAQKLDLQFYQGFIENCPFPKKNFDLITCSQVIEHVPDPLRFLNNCNKFLKPSGRIKLSFPNTGALYRKLWGNKWLHWHTPYHLNHFNKKSFKMLIDKSNLSIKSIKTVTPNLWTILQIKSYLNKPKEGIRDCMWDGIQAKVLYSDKQSSFQAKLVRKMLPFVMKLLLINRIIDIFGFGENSVAELKPKLSVTN